MLRPLLTALILAATPAVAQNVAFGGMRADITAPVEVRADNLSVNQADGSAVDFRALLWREYRDDGVRVQRVWTRIGA